VVLKFITRYNNVEIDRKLYGYLRAAPDAWRRSPLLERCYLVDGADPTKAELAGRGLPDIIMGLTVQLRSYY
jgi:hypothetical protein